MREIGDYTGARLGHNVETLGNAELVMGGIDARIQDGKDVRRTDEVARVGELPQAKHVA